MKKFVAGIAAALAVVSGIAFALDLSVPVIVGGQATGMQLLQPLYQVPRITTATTETQTASDSTIVFNAGGTATITLLSGAANLGKRVRIQTIAAQLVNSAGSNVIPCVGGSAGTAILTNTAGKWAELEADPTAGTNQWRITACN